MNLPDPENPSCRQATLASIVAHPSSHTVPQSPLRHTSTLPCELEPPLSLMSPCEHPSSTMDVYQYKPQCLQQLKPYKEGNLRATHATPASSEWEQSAVLLS